MFVIASAARQSLLPFCHCSAARQSPLVCHCEERQRRGNLKKDCFKYVRNDKNVIPSASEWSVSLINPSHNTTKRITIPQKNLFGIIAFFYKSWYNDYV